MTDFTDGYMDGGNECLGFFNEDDRTRFKLQSSLFVKQERTQPKPVDVKEYLLKELLGEVPTSGSPKAMILKDAIDNLQQPNTVDKTQLIAWLEGEKAKQPKWDVRVKLNLQNVIKHLENNR